jgi:hypothetical protein
MSRHRCRLLLMGVFSLCVAATAWAQEDLVDNPYYKFWAGSKPGSTATHREQTKLSGPEGKLVPGGVDEKTIAYKLIAVNRTVVVVEQVVTEQDFLGYIQAAPTRYIYPARWKKAHLERVVLTEGGKAGEETVKVGDKDMKCRTVAGTLKGSGGEQIEFKLWLSDDVPGTIVKQVRTARQKGEMIAETTTTLQSFKKAD